MEDKKQSHKDSQMAKTTIVRIHVSFICKNVKHKMVVYMFLQGISSRLN